eukprot:UN25856
MHNFDRFHIANVGDELTSNLLCYTRKKNFILRREDLLVIKTSDAAIRLMSLNRVVSSPRKIVACG